LSLEIYWQINWDTVSSMITPDEFSTPATVKYQ
jgi:hypothetical protein